MNITVNQAIRKGKWEVNGPTYLIFFGGLLSSLIGGALIKSTHIMGWGSLCSIIFGILWWSISITKWRIWAFENVRNVHELRQEAINAQLIHPEGSWLERLEIRNDNQKRKIKSLEKKFLSPDIPEAVEDDGSTPHETLIFYSKTSQAIFWIIGIGIMCWGIVLIINTDLLMFLIVPIGIIALRHATKLPKTNEPIITLNEKGIKTPNTNFNKWSNVKFARTELKGYGKHAKWHLNLDLKKRNGNCGEMMEINDLSKSPKKIKQLIKLYQHRNRTIDNMGSSHHPET